MSHIVKPKANADKCDRSRRAKERIETAAVAAADSAISRAEERRLARAERRAARRDLAG